MGSLLLLRPAVAALRERFPRAEIHILTLDRNREICGLFGSFDGIHTLDVSGGPFRLAVRILALFVHLRALRPDVVVDFEFFTRFSAVVTAMSGATRRAGFRAWEVWRGTLHNVTVPFNRYWHVEDNFAALAQALGTGKAPSLPPLRVGPEAEASAAALLSARGVNAEARLTLVNVNAGELALERRWPLDRFTAFLRELSARVPVTVLLIGSPSERGYVGEVHRAAGGGDRLVNVAGDADLKTLMALMRRAEVLVTNDSGPLHLAAAMGLRTVSLFGPETPVLYGPRGDRHRILFRNIPCSPCINVHDQKRVRCLFDRPLCMHEIPVEAVLRETMAALNDEPVASGRRLGHVTATA